MSGRPLDISRREFFGDFFGKKSIRRICAIASDSLSVWSPVVGGGPEEAGLSLGNRQGEPRFQSEPSASTPQLPEIAEPASWFDPCGDGNQ
jgi:hypothetical protein